ncbi:prostaglandin E synthase 3-like isoform X2 [Littorina saxatilis]|uniref:CS domain-containing protein n=2 Tax=Littorina saxatilis TaxID=31220 RepID=A0AAN9BPM3_9CAEN
MAASTKSGSGDASALHPHLEWAQRRDRVWLTVILENCQNPTYELKEKTFFFKGKGGTENLDHEITLELYGEIDPEKSTCKKTDRQLFFTIMKKDGTASYWPRLTKEQKKLHFLKTDFSRWRDEDDSEEEVEEKEDFNLDEMMNSMGGMGGFNGADLGGPAEEQEDSDDEELPDLQ